MEHRLNRRPATGTQKWGEGWGPPLLGREGRDASGCRQAKSAGALTSSVIPPNDAYVEKALLDVMNDGLAALEVHPLLQEPPSVSALHRFVAHSLVLARNTGRLLEHRIARNLDRDEPRLGAAARYQLRIHQPFPRSLEAELVRLGRPKASLEKLELPPPMTAMLVPIEQALAARDLPLAHVLLVQGVEALTQLLAQRGAELMSALGGPRTPFEARHHEHETLLFAGLGRLGELPDACAQRTALVDGLTRFFESAGAGLVSWLEGPPPERPTQRPRRRQGRWGTGDLPGGVA